MLKDGKIKGVGYGSGDAQSWAGDSQHLDHTFLEGYRYPDWIRDTSTICVLLAG